MFARLPIGLHNVLHTIYLLVINFSIIYGFRVCVGISVIPFECVYQAIVVAGILRPLLLDARCIRTTNPHTQTRELLSLQHYLFLPAHMRFSGKVWSDVRRVQVMVITSYAFALLYVRQSFN